MGKTFEIANRIFNGDYTSNDILYMCNRINELYELNIDDEVYNEIVEKVYKNAHNKK